MKIFKLAAIMLISIGLIASNSAPIAAAEGESIAMTPTSKRYSLDPGTAKKDTITVINDGTVEYTVRMYARPYSVDDESYRPIFSKLTPSTDAYQWVSFDTTEFSLAPGKSISIPYTITVPKNAESGGHYGVLFAETQPKKDDKGSVVRKKRVGSIVYATVSGNNKSEGFVDSTSIPFFHIDTDLAAVSRVRNTGNVDFVDKTSVSVKTVFGAEKYTNERDLAVLPNTTRKIDYVWENGSRFGLYNVTVTHTVLGKQTSVSSLVLLVPSFVLVLLMVTILVAIALIGVRVNRNKQPKTKKRAAKKKSTK